MVDDSYFSGKDTEVQKKDVITATGKIVQECIERKNYSLRAPFHGVDESLDSVVRRLFP